MQVHGTYPVRVLFRHIESNMARRTQYETILPRITQVSVPSWTSYSVVSQPISISKHRHAHLNDRSRPLHDYSILSDYLRSFASAVLLLKCNIYIYTCHVVVAANQVFCNRKSYTEANYLKIPPCDVVHLLAGQRQG